MFYSFVQKICAAFFAKFGIHMAVFSGGIVGRCFPLCTLTILYQQRGSHRRLGKAHGARDDLVEASCVSFASVQARKLNHYAASPLPTKPSGFAGSPRRASEKRIVGSLGKPVHFRPHKKRQYTALRALLSGTSLHLLDFNAWRSAIFSDQITFTNIFGRPCGKFVDAI